MRLYLLAIAATLLLTLPDVLRQLAPANLRWQPVTVGVLGLLTAGALAHALRGRPGMAVDFAAEFGKVALFYLLETLTDNELNAPIARSPKLN